MSFRVASCTTVTNGVRGDPEQTTEIGLCFFRNLSVKSNNALPYGGNDTTAGREGNGTMWTIWAMGCIRGDAPTKPWEGELNDRLVVLQI